MPFDKIAAAKISFAWAENDHKQIHEIYHKSSLYMFLLGGFLFLNITSNIHSLLHFSCRKVTRKESGCMDHQCWHIV